MLAEYEGVFPRGTLAASVARMDWGHRYSRLSDQSSHYLGEFHKGTKRLKLFPGVEDHPTPMGCYHPHGDVTCIRLTWSKAQ